MNLASTHNDQGEQELTTSVPSDISPAEQGVEVGVCLVKVDGVFRHVES